MQAASVPCPQPPPPPPPFLAQPRKGTSVVNRNAQLPPQTPGGFSVSLPPSFDWLLCCSSFIFRGAQIALLPLSPAPSPSPATR